MDDKEKKYLHHDILKWVIIGLIGFAVIILVFNFGVFIGSERARF